MISIFREKSSVSVFWLIALSIVVHSHFLIAPPQVIVSDKDIWMKALLSPLAGLPSGVLVFFFHAIIIIQALRISVILNNLRMFPKLSFIPALCYLLLTALYPLWNNITPSLVINFFVIWLFSLMAKMYSSSQAKSLIYNIGLFTGLIVLFFPPSLFLILVCFFALALLRPFHFNEWIILLLGIITPAYLTASFLFLNDNLKEFLSFLPQFHWHLPVVENKIPLFIAAATGALLIISGILSWQANTGRMIIQIRRCWNVLFVMFLFSIPFLFGLQGEDLSILLLGMVAASALASNTFVYSKSNLMQAILFWLVVIVIIFNNWFWLKT